MKRKSFRYRGIPFPAPFVRSVDYYYPTSFPLPPAGEQPAIRARKIFIIKQTVRPFDSRSGRATDPTGSTIQHLLVFDDHPDSLRLVFGRSAKPKIDRPTPPSARWWEPVLGGMLITGALILIFLPLFLKLRS